MLSYLIIFRQFQVLRRKYLLYTITWDIRVNNYVFSDLHR